MSITTWGWGSGSIVTWGWGSPVTDIPILFAKYAMSSAYTWVLGRDYVEVLSRDRGDLLLRVRPDDLDSRQWTTLLERVRGEVINRSKGWPWEL